MSDLQQLNSQETLYLHELQIIPQLNVPEFEPLPAWMELEKIPVSGRYLLYDENGDVMAVADFVDGQIALIFRKIDIKLYRHRITVLGEKTNVWTLESELPDQKNDQVICYYPDGQPDMNLMIKDNMSFELAKLQGPSLEGLVSWSRLNEILYFFRRFARFTWGV